MDSTIVTSETLDELAAFAGVGEKVAALTRRSMNGEIDFAEALRQRVAMLRGLSLEALERTWARTRLTPGARELVATMRAHNATTALVSGGFTFFTGRVAALLGFDQHRANVLLDDGTHLTGEVAAPILDRDAKLATLRELAAGLPNAHRLQLDLSGPIAGATLSPPVARLLLNALLLAAESLPGGGVVALHGDAADALVLRIEGARAAWPEGLGTMLAGADAAWEAIGEDQGLRPARLQGVITALLLHDAGAHARLLLAATPELAPPLLLELAARPA
jgi:HAD superfamily phosphoserine phosphatase-like hydrolase